MGAYKTWQEAKLRLAEEPGSEHLQAVVDYLQPAALEDYLTDFIGHNFSYSDEIPLLQTEDVPEFLAGLDEIRGMPAKGEVDKAKRALVLEIEKRVHALRKMNWTGEHLYGDAVDDALTVINSVAQGQPFPKLERFRCPSLWDSNTRCQHQLPHGGNHRYDSGDGERHVIWTDEQSVNPPKNYDAEPEKLPDRLVRRCRSLGGAERCDLNEAHDGRHMHRFPSGSTTNWSDSSATGVFVSGTELNKLAGEVFGAEGNSDPINRPAARCLFLHPGDGSIQCWLNHGHDGEHANATWRWAR